jgi:hypothetical protein
MLPSKLDGVGDHQAWADVHGVNELSVVDRWQVRKMIGDWRGPSCRLNTTNDTPSRDIPTE